MSDEETQPAETVDNDQALAALAALLGWALIAVGITMLLGHWATLVFIGVTITGIAKGQLE